MTHDPDRKAINHRFIHPSLILLMAIGLAVALMFEIVELKKIEAALSNQVGENMTLRHELFGARLDQAKWIEFRDRIASIKSRGFAPDSLVVWTICDMRDRYRSIDWDLIDSVASFESSWGYNKRMGTVGEKGWAQIREETWRDIVWYLGGDTAGLVFRPTVQSSTEMFYAMATLGRMLNDDLKYEHWNRGIFAKIKKRKGYKPKPFGRYSLN